MRDLEPQAVVGLEAPVVESSPTPRATGATGQIALVGEDDNIWVILADGSHLGAITSDASPNQLTYRYPTWSPDGQTLAFVELATDGGAPQKSALHFVAPGGSERRRVNTAFPPFYLSWSPTSDTLAFLSSGERGTLALRGVDVARGAREAATISEGQPFYFSWHPGGQRMLAHIGARELAFVGLGGDRERLDVEAGLFQAPHWSTDGERLAYVTGGESPDNVLVISDAAGDNAVPVAARPGLFTFNWSPDSRRLAYSFTEERVGLAAFGPLWVRDIATGQAWELSREPVLAFFWSPDASKLAFLRLDRPDTVPHAPQSAPLRQESPIWFRWHIWNGERTYPLARFAPSDSFLLDYVRYFDQYAQSISLWSPDSTTLLFAGTSDDGRAGIWTLPVEPGSRPHRIARGTLATWSPR
jgi:TolB protein